MGRHRINGDDLARVDNIWRGPRGITFAWRARFVAYGIFAACLVFLLAVEHRAGVFTPWPVFFAVLISIGAARTIGERIGFEVSFRAYVHGVWLDLTAPRRTVRATVSTLTPARVVFKERAPHVQPNPENARVGRRIRRGARPHR